MSIYDFIVKDTKQNEVSLKKYEGNVLLIVNTATSCGYTPQYQGIEKLYKIYRSKGFEVLDFPCNQFLSQAKGTDAHLAQFCQLNYDTTFQTFAKIKVNGKETHPLYQFLKNQKPEDYQIDEVGFGIKKVIAKLTSSESKKAIKWNFTKFLVDRNGNVIYRFAPTFKPEDIESFIQKVL